MSGEDMNEDRLGALSALMDDEQAPAPAQRTLDALRADPALRARWARYHTISAALADQHVPGADSLAQRVGAALDAEPVSLPARVPARRRGARRLLAVAASVAMLAVAAGLFLAQQGPTPAPTPVASADPPAVEPAPSAIVPVAQRATEEASSDEFERLTRLTWNDPNPQVAQRLNGYLLTHNEYLATGVRGMLPYARVVGYEPAD